MDAQLQAVSTGLKVAVVILAPIVLLYAIAAWHSKSAKKSRRENGAFWHVVLGTLLLGASQLSQYYGDAFGNGYAKALSSLLILAVLALFFLLLRRRIHDHMDPLVKKKWR